MLTFQLKWACNLQAQRGVDPRPPAPIIHMLAQAVGKQVRGVAEVTNGVGGGQELVPVRIRAGTQRALAGIRVVVHGVVHPAGIFKVLYMMYLVASHNSTCISGAYSLIAFLFCTLRALLGCWLIVKNKTKARSPQFSFKVQALEMIDLLEVRLPSQHSPGLQTHNDRLPSQDWPTSPWAVSSFWYVPGHLTRVLCHPNSALSSALFRCSFERKFVCQFGPQRTSKCSPVIAVHQRSRHWNGLRSYYGTILRRRIRPSPLGI